MTRPFGSPRPPYRPEGWAWWHPVLFGGSLVAFVVLLAFSLIGLLP